MRRDTGFYTQDPVFAAHVRQALRLGYRPVVYKSNPAQAGYAPGLRAREDGKARNLQAFPLRTLGAKLLVHVGRGHVSELLRLDAAGARTLMMAARLKQLTGITRAAVLVAAGRPLLLGTPSTDLQVVHPARAYRHGRPTWLAALGGCHVAVPAGLLPHTGERSRRSTPPRLPTRWRSIRSSSPPASPRPS